MKKLLLRSAIFLIPLALWAAIVVIIDPFNYFGVSGVISDEIKLVNAKQLNRLMYNVFEENRLPATKLLIGDSRSNSIIIEHIEEFTGEDYFQLNSNALKLNEAVELYWLANRMARVEKVYMTINFNMFNQYSYANRVSGVESMLNNPFLYIFDRSVAAASYIVVKAALRKEKVVDSRPPMTREEFWDLNVRVKANDHYGKYRYPGAVYDEMKKMAEHANKNGIDIVLIIVPHHVDMQKRVEDYGLKKEMIRFKKDMFELGIPVIDYDYDNEITRERENFTDPIHFDFDTGDLIIREVWGRDLKYGRRLTEQYIDSLAAAQDARL